MCTVFVHTFWGRVCGWLLFSVKEEIIIYLFKDNSNHPQTQTQNVCKNTVRIAPLAGYCRVCVRKPGLDVVQLVCVSSKVGGFFSGVACITLFGPGDADAADGGRTSFWGLVDNSSLWHPWLDFQFKRWGFSALCKQSSSILARSALDSWPEQQQK